MTTLTPDRSTEFSVREAERDDLLAIHRIERTSFPQPWPYAAFERYVGEPGFLVSEHRHESDREGDADVAGYVVADTIPDEGRLLGHVKDIAVAPSFRGNGIGTTLLERALSIVASDGASAAKLEVRASNNGAISLYRDHDFVHQRTIRDYYGNDEDALVMVRDLG